MQLSQNFTLRELTKSQTAERKGIDNTPDAAAIEHLTKLAENILQPIRDEFGSFIVSSGFRCAELSVAYLPCAERVSFLQLESKLPLAAIDESLNFALEGCRQVYVTLREAVERRMQQTLASRGMLSG